jgi:hypothetical protein
MLDQGGLQQVVNNLMKDAAQTHLAPMLQENAQEISDGRQQEAEDAAPEGETPATQPKASTGMSAMAPVPGAQRAPDGAWYLTDPTRSGKYLRVAPLAQEHMQRGIVGNG